VSLLASDLRFIPGDWINIIGYLEKEESAQIQAWTVKAIMAWKVTPGFDLNKYEEVVNQRMSSIL
jgi:hypothetical protein